MAFAPKIDRCGLLAAVNPSGPGAKDIIGIRDENENGSVSEHVDNVQDGSFDPDGPYVYGEDSTPDNSYALRRDAEIPVGAIRLNHITSIVTGEDPNKETRNYALAEVTFDTALMQAVKISAKCQLVEAETTDDTNQDLYWLPKLKLVTDQIAQDVAKAFTLSGQKCELTKCTTTFACTVSPDKLVGVIISSDCNSGLGTVTGTVLSRAGVVPTITPNPDPIDLGNEMSARWVLTQSPKNTAKNPEEGKKEFSFTLKLSLAKKMHDSEEESSSSQQAVTQ